MDPIRTAWGIHEIVTNNMAESLRTHAAERGVDTRKLVMVAFGGAGPLHAWGIAQALRIPTVLLPRAAGVFSALGFLTAPLSFDLARSAVGELEGLDPSRMCAVYEEMEGRSMALFAQAGLLPDAIRFERSVDMRYAGQGFEITVALPDEALKGGDVSALARAYNEAYRAQYGRTVAGAPVQVVTWRCLALGPRPELRLQSKANSRVGQALKGRRTAYLPTERRSAAFPVYNRYALAPSDEIQGPALVEERECTVLVGPGALARVDTLGNLAMEMQP